jgi:hypothetical protein
MKKILFIVALIFINLTCIGHENNPKDKQGYSSGFIVTNDNDTLRGLIKDRTGTTFTKIYKRVRFKDGGLFPKKFSPSKIKKYCTAEGCYESIWLDVEQKLFRETYYSQPGRGKRVFMKVTMNGYLSLYYLEFIDGESGNPDYIELFKRRDEDYLIRVTQGIFLRKQALIDFFHDCPELAEQIDRDEIKKPGDMVRFYNSSQR